MENLDYIIFLCVLCHRVKGDPPPCDHSVPQSQQGLHWIQIVNVLFLEENAEHWYHHHHVAQVYEKECYATCDHLEQSQ